MSVGVVDRLEVVDVEHQDAERRRDAHGAAELLVQAPQTEATVVDAGERVQGGEALQAIVGDCVVQRQPETLQEEVDPCPVVRQ